MRESKAESIERIQKLVDTLNQCSRRLKSDAQTQVAPAFGQFAEKLSQTTERFEFELRTELRRMAAEAESPASECGPDLGACLAGVVHSYQEALGSKLSAHSRAMITRQSEEIRKSYSEFESLNRAA